MIDFENNENPYEEKRSAIAPWKMIAAIVCRSSDIVLSLGHDIMKLGIKAKDALHIACAITSGCKYFITTDNKLTNKHIEGISIINPIDFIRVTEEPA